MKLVQRDFSSELISFPRLLSRGWVETVLLDAIAANVGFPRLLSRGWVETPPGRRRLAAAGVSPGC